MNRRRFVAGLALTVSAVLGIAGPLAAGKQVPFTGTLEGTYTRTGSFPFFHLEPTGTGEASHLGRFSFSIPHDVNLLAVPAGGTGTFEFTAANGDTIFGTFDTSAIPTDVPGVIDGTEEMTITGGTGRFENASGAFTCKRLVDTVNLTFAGSFSGTISSVGSSKR